MSTDKAVVFLASYGTSVIRAKEDSYDKIQAELAISTGLPVWQVFTNDDLARAINGFSGPSTMTVEDALETAIIHGYNKVIVVPVFFSEGHMYQALSDRLNFYRDRVDVEITRAVIYDEASARECAKLLMETVKPEKKLEYLFVGHGAAGQYANRYTPLQEEITAMGYENVRVLRLIDKDCVGQAIAWLKKREADTRDAQVVIVPMVVAWGDYMAEELFNAPDSFMAKLRKAGFRTVFTGIGLGEYPTFRQIYVTRMKELAHGEEE